MKDLDQLAMQTVPEIQDDPAEFALRFIHQTNQSVFLTGKAGTGKTTLLKQIIATTHKKAVIVAPTGIAALNAGGVTIHSFFQLPFGAFIPEFLSAPPFSGNVKFETKETLRRRSHFNKQRTNLLRSMELLVIDEVSMLRSDMLDAIDWVLRTVRKENKPFGGVQVLYIGDLLQLPPVVKQEEWQILRAYYFGQFFFHAKVMEEQRPIYIELEKVYRQKDADFLGVLNNLRNNQVNQADLDLLQKYVRPDFRPESEEGYITLTTHNTKAETINQRALADLQQTSFYYDAEVGGEFPEHIYPLEGRLELKVGAQVMFIKNDISFDKLFFNGKMGRIASLSKHEIKVYFPEERKTIDVEKYEWTNIKYTLDEATGEIKEEELGTFVQYPIKLAWAITVHKSQGLTFDKAVLDVSQVFAPGQAYVALSRLRSLDGLVLLKPMTMNGLINDQQVVNYASSKHEVSALNQYLEYGTLRYIHDTLIAAFDWHETVSKFQIAASGFQLAGPKTEKGKDKVWFAHQCAVIEQTSMPAKKFQQQLSQIFAKEHIDLAFVQERVEAAYAYFFKPMDQVVYALLKKMAELRLIKKTKVIVDELAELEVLLTAAVLKMKRSRALVDALVQGKELTREHLRNEDILQYKTNKLIAIEMEVGAPRSLLDMDEEDDSDYKVAVPSKKAKKEVGEKVVKATTYDKTFELYELGRSIEDIARLRQLSKSTIYSHFVQLVKAGKVEITAILSSERISQMDELMIQFEGQTLTQIKEQVGDDFSYDELKLYQASKFND